MVLKTIVSDATVVPKKHTLSKRVYTLPLTRNINGAGMTQGNMHGTTGPGSYGGNRWCMSMRTF